jgi:polyhydroxyalkanoate synthase
MTTTGSQRIGRAGKELPGSKQPVDKSDASRDQTNGKPTAASAKKLTGKHPEPTVASVEQSGREATDSYSTLSIDRAFKAHLARFTLGISPAGILSKYFEWLAHLSVSPGKQLQLIEKAQRKNSRFMVYASSYARDPKTPPCIEPLPQDRRFNHESWQSWPYNFMYQAFLLTQQWWDNATNDIDGLSRKDEQAISFVTRQFIDLFSPSNFIGTNPEVVQATLAQGGNNLVLGFKNFLEDWERAISGKPPVGAERFVVGRDVATASGKVVYRNHLIELIQYSPTTEKVHPEPILIVPAWIMKYYILDLSPHNSMVKYLVERGFTVFMISWRNPTSADRDLGMEDYLDLGVESALRAIAAVVPDKKVHAVGYCIGGTLLAIAAAAMARDHDDTVKTLTFLTTQTDFTEAGELMLFVRESGLSYLENMMWDQGYLDTKQMAGAFQMLRSNDMIWSRYVREYLMGERPKMFDLMAWNADATRMPYRMHSEYLRRLYLSNELARGQYRVKGRPVTLSDVRTPIFAVATTSDHVAPWQSVYKLHLLTDTDLTFVLTNGGHNAGIISEPGRKGRRFQIATRRERETYNAPDEWLEQSPSTEGSWWTAWTEWLAAHSQAKTSPPPMGAASKGLRALGDAPGVYVRQL